MYGGTAKTFVNWEFIGEPFKDGSSYYIFARNPKTGITRKVRWYTDKVHADLMPNKKKYPALWELFGFANRDDMIITVHHKMLTPDEEDQFSSSPDWRFGVFFGGVWYAPKDTPRPAIKSNAYVYETWPNIVAEACANLEENGIYESDWHKELNHDIA